MNRDPGLQPERTAMSWLRTQLVLFALGVACFKVAAGQLQLVVALLGIITMATSILTTFYKRARFRQLFHDTMAVGHREYNIKRALSILNVLLAGAFLAQIWW